MATAIVFKYKTTQAVCLPMDAHFPDHVKKVSVRIVGQNRILTPVVSTWDSFFLQGTAVTDDFMTERSTQEQPERERF